MTAAARVGTVRPVLDVEGFLDRWRRLPPPVADVLLAVVVGAVTVVSVVVEDQQDDDLALTAWGVALLGVQIVPLVWRRRAPVATFALVCAATFAYGFARLPDPPIMFAAGLAVYTLAAYRRLSVSAPLALAVLVAAAVGIWFGDESDVADLAVGYFVGITCWVVGDTVRRQRVDAARAEARRVDEARRAVADERVRIARDLHDVVAHHLSVIVVQAEAAQEVLAADPERAGSAMAAVADTARTALGELRRVLGVLRSDSTLVPQPDLGGVDELVESVRQAGLAVEVRTEGDPCPVPGVVGLTAYRVVQEALTNVLRHASAHRAVVALDFAGTGELVVTVIDDGRGHATGSGRPGGHGLAGMRERVAVLGGRLDAGPRAEGGFAVRAHLPLAP
jgi:signal transduction histidine kinase